LDSGVLVLSESLTNAFDGMPVRSQTDELQD